jgi:hypothetical protein
VARDLGRFFLEFFPFCGCDRFVPRGDQGREFFFKRAAVFRAFHKFVVKLNGIIAVHFVIGAIVLFTIPVLRDLHLAIALFDDRRSIRLREPD